MMSASTRPPAQQDPRGKPGTSARETDGERLSLALQVEGLTKTYGNRRVVDDVSLWLERGEVFGFLGPNGSTPPRSSPWSVKISTT